MKHLKKFNEASEFEAVKSELAEPWVAYSKNDNVVHFKGGVLKEYTKTFCDNINGYDSKTYTFTVVPTYNQVFGSVPSGMRFKGWNTSYNNFMKPGSTNISSDYYWYAVFES